MDIVLDEGFHLTRGYGERLAGRLELIGWEPLVFKLDPKACFTHSFLLGLLDQHIQAHGERTHEWITIENPTDHQVEAFARAMSQTHPNDGPRSELANAAFAHDHRTTGLDAALNGEPSSTAPLPPPKSVYGGYPGN